MSKLRKDKKLGEIGEAPQASCLVALILILAASSSQYFTSFSSLQKRKAWAQTWNDGDDNESNIGFRLMLSKELAIKMLIATMASPFPSPALRAHGCCTGMCSEGRKSILRQR